MRQSAQTKAPQKTVVPDNTLAELCFAANANMQTCAMLLLLITFPPPQTDTQGVVDREIETGTQKTTRGSVKKPCMLYRHMVWHLCALELLKAE